jgi:hypothetical protein
VTIPALAPSAYGTMTASMSAPRWLRVLCLLAVLAFFGPAHAQVFKPRTAKNAPAKATPVKKSTIAAAPTKRASHAAPHKKKRAKKSPDDDTVVVDDDDEPDVKITDD